MRADAASLASPRSMPWSRVMGLTSIYAKTVRDSRRAALAVGGIGGLFMFITAAPYGAEFTTPESRAQLVAQMTALPAVMRGLLGEPINIDTLGGFVSWRVGNFLPVLLGLWPVIALSGTLVGEAAKGSLDSARLDAREPSLHRAPEAGRPPHGGGGRDAAHGRARVSRRPGVRRPARRRDRPARCARVRPPHRAPDGGLRIGLVRGRPRGRAYTGRGHRPGGPVRRLPHRLLWDALRCHRRARAADLVRLDRRSSTARRRDRLAVRGPSRRRHGRAARGRRRRLPAPRHRSHGGPRLAPPARVAQRDARLADPAALRSGARRDRLGRRHRPVCRPHRGVRRGIQPGDRAARHRWPSSSSSSIPTSTSASRPGSCNSRSTASPRSCSGWPPRQRSPVGRPRRTSVDSTPSSRRRSVRTRWFLASSLGVLLAVALATAVLGAIVVAAIAVAGGSLAHVVPGVALLGLAASAFAGRRPGGRRPGPIVPGGASGGGLRHRHAGPRPVRSGA